MNRKLIVLVALLCVLAVCLIYAYVATPRLETAPPGVGGEKAPAPVEAGDGSSKASRIDFSYMENDPASFASAKRDIFRFGSQRPIDPVKPQPVVEPVTPEESDETDATPATVTPIEVVQKSLSRFTFLGFLEKAGEKTVFLSSSGELFLVKQGERFGVDEEFYIKAIDGNILKVTHSGRDGLIEIPLIEQRKLRAAAGSAATLPRESAEPESTNNRVFKPMTKVKSRPVMTPEKEEKKREFIEAFNPEKEQGLPAEGVVEEGEVNGTKQ